MNMRYTKMDIWAIPDADEREGFRLELMPTSRSWCMSESDVRLGTASVPFQVPDDMSHEEMVRKAVETLRDRQKQILAEARRRVTALDARINELLMLTHNPEPQSDDNVIDIGASHSVVEDASVGDVIPF